MATKQNTNITVKVVTLGGNDFTATDTDAKKYGAAAFNNFQYHETVVIADGSEKTIYVPFHAIDHVEVTKATTEVEYTDDNCVEDEETTPDEGGEDDNEGN